MRVLGILGSPRRGGNSEILLDKALEGAGGLDTEKIVLNELKFSPCQECGGCAKSGNCIIDDEMQLVYKKIDEADIVILASPVFFGSLPAQVKAMVDRYQCRWVSRYVLKRERYIKGKKKGLLILVSASERDKFFKNAESIVKNFFAVAGIEFKGNLYCPNIDDKGKILGEPDYLRRALELLPKSGIIQGTKKAGR